MWSREPRAESREERAPRWGDDRTDGRIDVHSMWKCISKTKHQTYRMGQRRQSRWAAKHLCNATAGAASASRASSRAHRRRRAARSRRAPGRAPARSSAASRRTTPAADRPRSGIGAIGESCAKEAVQKQLAQSTVAQWGSGRAPRARRGRCSTTPAPRRPAPARPGPASPSGSAPVRRSTRRWLPPPLRKPPHRRSLCKPGRIGSAPRLA